MHKCGLYAVVRWLGVGLFITLVYCVETAKYTASCYGMRTGDLTKL